MNEHLKNKWFRLLKKINYRARKGCPPIEGSERKNCIIVFNVFAQHIVKCRLTKNQNT